MNSSQVELYIMENYPHLLRQHSPFLSLLSNKSRNSTFPSNALPPLEEIYEDGYIFANRSTQVCLFIIYSIVFFFCFFGNLTVVLVMTLHWKMRSIAKFCLGNLAFANLCVGIFCIYQNLSMYIIESWIFGDFMCKMYHFTNSLSYTASVLLLVVISVERYLVIIHPFKYRRIVTMQRLKLLMVGVWSVGALLCGPRLYYIETMENPLVEKTGSVKSEVICVILSNLYDSHTADMIQFILLFLLPLCIITILYAKVGYFLRKQSIPFETTTANNVPQGSMRRGGVPFQEARESLVVSLRLTGDGTTASTTTTTTSTTTTMGNKSKMQIREFWNWCKSTNCAGCGSCNNSQRRRQGVQSTASDQIHNGTLIRRSHLAAVRMLTVHVLTFSLCNLPFHLRKLFQNYVPEGDSDSDFMELATPLSFLLMYTNCAINPIVYAFMSKAFRTCLLDLMKCKTRNSSPSVRSRRT